MNTKRENFVLLLVVGVSATLMLLARGQSTKLASNMEKSSSVVATEADLAPSSKIEKSNEEWKVTLSPAEFAVMRQKATERPGSSPLVHEHRTGVFHCAACG